MADAADAYEPQKSLWLQVLWRPVFRSLREKVVFHSVSFVALFAVIYPVVILAWLDSLLTTVMCLIGVMIVYAAGVWIWLTWGRRRFPLAQPDAEPAGG